MSPTPDLQPLRDFLTAVEAQEDPRVLIRWTDESRIQPDAAGGYTVCRVMRATLTAKIDGAAAQHTADGVSLLDLQAIVREHDIDPLYRPDNVSR
jgi:hypothetical protein